MCVYNNLEKFCALWMRSDEEKQRFIRKYFCLNCLPIRNTKFNKLPFPYHIHVCIRMMHMYSSNCIYWSRISDFQVGGLSSHKTQSRDGDKLLYAKNCSIFSVELNHSESAVLLCHMLLTTTTEISNELW